ncbi:hypothetical protein B0H12DRAFT_1242086 [Mycena haematopus]|nr:hypothetical protein B0H12DRAFT_1242086 [Mycena haematopus]
MIRSRRYDAFAPFGLSNYPAWSLPTSARFASGSGGSCRQSTSEQDRDVEPELNALQAWHPGPSSEFVLEAFVNARTLFNPNTSRGKYTELQVGEGPRASRRTLDYHLKRSSTTVLQAIPAARDYIVAGASPEERVLDKTTYCYLSQGHSQNHQVPLFQLGNLEFIVDRHRNTDGYALLGVHPSDRTKLVKKPSPSPSTPTTDPRRPLYSLSSRHIDQLLPDPQNLSSRLNSLDQFCVTRSKAGGLVHIGRAARPRRRT